MRIFIVLGYATVGAACPHDEVVSIEVARDKNEALEVARRFVEKEECDYTETIFRELSIVEQTT